MATVYSLVCNGGSSGSYWNNLSASQKLRYGESGSERVYSGLVAWRAARYSAASPYDTEIAEIADAFTELITSQFYFDIPCASMQVTTLVDGIRKGGFHFGVVDAGYIIQCNAAIYGNLIRMNYPNAIADGYTLYPNSYYAYGIRVESDICTVGNMIINPKGKNEGTYAVLLYYSAATKFYNNLIINAGGAGLRIDSNNNSSQVYNNIIAKCVGVGVQAHASARGSYVNNIAIGNGTNWSTVPTLYNGQIFAGNFGESGDSPWDDGSSTSGVISSSDFTDYANDDFTPASASSPQVDSGIFVFGGVDVDISGNRRPSYEPANYPNEIADVGCYEYDKGNGLPPMTVEVSITGMAEGSALAIYNSSTNAEIVAPTTIGASGAYTDSSFVYTSDVPIKVVVRKGTSATKYLPYNQLGTITSSGFSLIVTQIPDTVS